MGSVVKVVKFARRFRSLVGFSVVGTMGGE